MRKVLSIIWNVVHCILTTLVLVLMMGIFGISITILGVIFIPFCTIRDAIDGENYFDALSYNTEEFLTIFYNDEIVEQNKDEEI